MKRSQWREINDILSDEQKQRLLAAEYRMDPTEGLRCTDGRCPLEVALDIEQVADRLNPKILPMLDATLYGQYSKRLRYFIISDFAERADSGSLTPQELRRTVKVKTA